MSKQEIVLLGGLPGSGKTTLAESIVRTSKRYSFVSIGDRLRDIVAGTIRSAYTDRVREEMELLSHSMRMNENTVSSVVIEAINDLKTPVVLLDGYPRFVDQIQPLKASLDVAEIDLRGMLYITTNHDEAVRRVVERGSRAGERVVDEAYARERVESYEKLYKPVVEAISKIAPVYRIDSSGNKELLLKQSLGILDRI